MRRLAVQIALSFLALTLLTVGIGAVAAALLGRLGGAVTQTLDENVRSVVAAERMGRALDAAEAARLGDDDGEAERADRAFRDALGEARTAAVLPEEPALLDTLAASFDAYRQGEASAARVDGLRARLLVLNERAATERAQRAEAAGERARRLLLLAVACAVVASGVAGALLTRRITRPLRDLTAGVAEVGRGDFRQRVGAGAGGEVGALARAFNEMAERLEAYEALNVRALLREKRTAESLVAAIPSPVVVTEGPDARVRLVNEAAEALVGGGAPGRPLAEVASALASARPSDGPDPLVEVGHQTFRLRRTEVSVPAEPDEPTGSSPDRLAVLVLDDVTPFRALDVARREFLAAVSHELRTPLTSMHVAADLLLRGAVGPLSDDQRELAEIVRGDVERMKALTARLLDLARVEVGGRPVGPVDLSEVAHAAAEGVRLVAAERGVDVAVEAAGVPIVEGDADGLAMALSNLAANAVRHAASRVVVRVEAPPGGVRLAVEDDGPGLPDDAVDRVFEPLVQLGTPDDARAGSAGLGLTIVRRVAEAHGGRAWAEPGPGGRFFVSIPAVPSPSP
ncbi:ATP-binding protein [Rubrivirga marina]|uniref:histidine kinase n=1 Tax=Rubrivirga marina TaxID=1196024 RepID=A0A271J1J2_9BACT|nr:ATP-binding protein [Rubrivirga marina]PAP77118.1 hypothetical protein BSZ37_12120 [Rubrivirga marina]